MHSRAPQQASPIAVRIERCFIAAAITSLMLSLTGCAGVMAYRDGKELVSEGKVEAGLAKFQEAVAADPHDARYRSAYLQTRERSLASFFAQADQLAAGGNRDAAEKLYQRALAIEPGNDRATAGLRKLETDARHAQWLKEAESAFAKKDMALTKQKLANILAENPDHASARTMQRTLIEQSEKSSTQSVLSNAYKKPITIDFKDVPIKQIFEVISRTSGLNFLFDKEVKTDQRTSIFLRNSTIESAVHFTLMTNQLEQQILDSNTILIYPNNTAKLKDYQEMVVRTFYLTNTEAKTIANTIKTIIKTRDIVVDEKLNLLIMRDSPEAIKLAEKLIALQDVAEPEVMLEVEIMEIKRSRLQQLGIQWPSSLGLTPLPLAGQSVASGSGTGTAGTTTGTTTSSNTLTLNDLRQQNSRTLGAAVGSATVNANVQDGDANLLANPRIRVRNREKAKILIGERVPNITTTATSSGFISESVNYVDVGLTLNVEPTVYLDNDVAIKVTLEVSNIIDIIKTQSGTTAYRIGTRNANTVLRLKNGETQVLAGLINDEERHSGNRIPGLGEVPILGRLFGNATDDSQKTEIVLSITPRLIRNLARPEIIDAEFRAGTDSTLRNRPDSGGGALSASFNAPISAPISSSSNVSKPALKNDNQSVPSAQASTPINALPSGVPGGLSTPLQNAGSATTIPDPVSGGSSSSAPTSGVQMRWQGQSPARVGDIVTLKLAAQTDQAVSELPFTITYDSKLLQVAGINEGDFLKQGNAVTTFTADIKQNGQIVVVSKRSDGTGATAPNIAAVINFRTMAATDATSIHVLSGVPLGVNNRPIGMFLTAPFNLKVTP